MQCFNSRTTNVYLAAAKNTPRYYSRFLCPESRSAICKCSTPETAPALACDTESVTTRFIVRQELEDKSRFMSFDNYDKFRIYLASLDSADRCFHEIIVGPRPQRFKVDLDFSEDVRGLSMRYANTVADEMCKLISIMFFYKISTIDADYRPRACITYSKGSTNGPAKIGFHITIGGELFAATNLEVEAFVARLITVLPKEISDAIDKNTSKSLQNWRILGCHKKGRPDRVKRLLNPATDIHCDAIITQFATSGSASLNSSMGTGIIILTLEGPPIPSNLILLPTNARRESVAESNITESDLRILCESKLTEAERAANMFSNIVKSQQGVYFVNFRRIAPGFCDKCKRVHDADNTLYFTYKRTVYKNCRHAKTDVFVSNRVPILTNNK